MLPLRLEPCAGPPEGAPRPRRGMPRLRRSCGPAAGQEGGIPLPGQRRQSQPLQQVLMHLDRAVRDAFDRKSPQRFPVFKKKFVCADSLRYFQSRTVEGVAQLVRGGPDRGRDPRAAAPVPEHGGRRPRCGALPNPVRRHRVPAAQLFRETGTAPGPGRAPSRPLGQAFPELAQAEGRDHRTAYPDRRRQQRLPAQGLQRHQQKPRCRRAGGAAGGQHERIGRGTLLAPGCRVRQKGGLNRAILDQGWGEFARQLEYKESWLVGMVLYVDAACTSQKCSRCGQCAPGNQTGQASFACLSSRLGGPCRRQRGTEHSGGGARRHRLWRARRSRAARRSRNLRSRCGASRIGP